MREQQNVVCFRRNREEINIFGRNLIHFIFHFIFMIMNLHMSPAPSFHMNECATMAYVIG